MTVYKVGEEDEEKTDIVLSSGSKTDNEPIQAENSITLGGTVVYAVESGGNVLYEAGSSIVLLPGTHLKEGTKVVLKITPNLQVEDNNSPGEGKHIGLRLTEHHIYGSSRLGIQKAQESNEDDNTYYNTIGDKRYELSSHLGNVVSVISDRKLAVYDATSTTFIKFTPDVLSFSDYMPFGMQMPNRNSQGDYRYAYQGQEKDPETGKVAFQLRLYDPRINRWLTTDPKGQYHSPYLSMGNNPVSRIDPDGGTDGDPSDGAIVYNQDMPGMESITLQMIDGRIQEVNMLNEVTVNAITPISNTFLHKSLFRLNESTIAAGFKGDQRVYSMSDKCGTVDCSRLTRDVARMNGYEIPRNAYKQAKWYQDNSEWSSELSSVQAGDHIFWKRGTKAYHTGIVLSAVMTADGVKKITVIQAQKYNYKPGSIQVRTLKKNGEIPHFGQPFMGVGRR